MRVRFGSPAVTVLTPQGRRREQRHARVVGVVVAGLGMNTRRWLYERAIETLKRAVATREPWERTRLLLEAVALRDLSRAHGWSCGGDDLQGPDGSDLV